MAAAIPTRSVRPFRGYSTYEVSLIPFDADYAEEFGRVRADLRRQGISVDNMDLLIGATALVYDLTVVTHNTRHFQQIPGLRLEDWLTP